MAFTGYKIFPGLTFRGVVSPNVQELITTFNLEALQALQALPEEDLAWADICGVTAGDFVGKVPLDLTSIDGFEPFEGTRTFKQIDITAIQIEANRWQRNLSWDLVLDQAGNATVRNVYNLGGIASALVMHARLMKARIAATVLMQGTPGTNLAQVYAGTTIPGAGKSLFNTTHLANPLDANSKQFSNYFAAAGAFNATQFATMRKNMRLVPSPVSSVETLGMQVTDIIGPSHMEEPFRQLALQQLSLQTTTTPGNLAGATTNIYAAGSTAWKYHIAPQLDGDPFVTSNAGKHMWIAVSRKLPNVRPIEMLAPSKEFTPRIQFFGDGSEMAAMQNKVFMLADLAAGAAAGIPHCVARYEET